MTFGELLRRGLTERVQLIIDERYATGIILGPKVLKYVIPFSPVPSMSTDRCHDWPYSVVQLLPGGWDTGDETDHAKEILLWVRD
jgi:hypothetical protein